MISNSNYIITFCIPTKNRPHVLKNTLDSILLDQENVSEIEILISDNSSNSETKELVERYQNQFDNLRYVHNRKIGFFNSLNALDYGNGRFLKLHNDYTKVCKGKLRDIIGIIKKYEFSRPGILFTNNELRSNHTREFVDFDSFIKCSSFWNSWSSAFGIWKDDYIGINDKYNRADDQFPHTSILFLSCQHKRKNVIVDDTLFENQVVLPKGGYNLFKIFANNYLDILNKYAKGNSIKKSTCRAISNQLLGNFFYNWVNLLIIKKDPNFTFDNSNWCKYLWKRYNTNPLFYYYIFKSILYYWVLKVKGTSLLTFLFSIPKKK